MKYVYNFGLLVDYIIIYIFSVFNRDLRQKNKLNNFKYIECNINGSYHVKSNITNKNYIVISIKNNTTDISCNICESKNNFEDMKDYNRCIKMSCCKYSNTICLNCIKTIFIYKCKNENNKFNLFIKMNCPFCTNEIYLLDMKPKHIQQILNNCIK